MANHHLSIRSIIRILVFITTLIQLTYAQTKCNYTLPFSKNDVSGIILKNPEYTNDIHSCWYMVKVEEGYGFILEFQSFNLQEKACFDERNNEKCCDYLQIGTGNQVHKNVYNTYCGNDKLDPIILQSNSVWFNFHTDSSVTSDGFKIKVKKFQLTYTEPTGQISSPELRFRYPNNLNLTYTILTEKNSVTFLRFERLSIESYNNSCIDYLEIGSLDPSSNQKTQVICGEDTVDKLIINSNQVYLKFVTDRSETFSGFSIFYNTIKYLYTESSGVIESSKYAMNFTYKIIAPKDKLIEIMVDAFDFKKCSLNTSELLMDYFRPSCSLNNDYLMFQNERGSLNETIFKEINNIYSSVKGMNVQDNWVFCGCSKSAKIFLSLTNELTLKYFLAHKDQIDVMNYFRVSYRFVPSENSKVNSLRVVQNNVKTGFIGGYMLKISVPANNHLIIYGKSAKCSFPKQSLVIKEINEDIWSINQLNLFVDEFKKNCSYSIDFAEPKIDQFVSNRNPWKFSWFLKINSPNDIFDFELNWEFIKNQIVDEKRDYEIHLPKVIGFELNERVHDELDFYLKTTTNRRYTLSFDIEPKYFIDIQDTANYIKTKVKNSNKIDMHIPIEHLHNKQNEYLVNAPETLLKIKRNSKYSIGVSIKLDRHIGDCNFDDSVCEFTLNPFLNQTLFSSLFTSNDGHIIRHLPKFNNLDTNDFDLNEKSQDFYLSVSKTSQNEDALYSPLINVQELESNGKWKLNRKVYSLSFSYMMTNKTTSQLEVFIMPNRSDIKHNLRGEYFLEKIGLFSKDSFMDSVLVSKSKETNECPANSFSFWLSDKNKRTSKTESRLDVQGNWYRVNRARFFSCFDFRFGFAINLEEDLTDDKKLTKINPIKSTIGLDDIELNDEGDVALCSDKTCNNNGKCFEFNGKSQCCCNSGYEGDLCEKKLSACELAHNENGDLPCKNGNCHDLDKGFDYKCECAKGYTGQSCEIEINECDSNPCLNNGRCIDRIGSFECICRNGFSGRRCEQKDANCKEKCSPIGTAECFNDHSNVFCKCKPDFTSDDCSIKIRMNKCISDPCAGDAKCVPDSSGFKCLCPPDRTGKFCEQKINFCNSFDNLCRNGSACIFANEDGSNFKCSCAAGFTGIHCDEPVNDCDPNPCVNGKCIDQHLGYICECPKGFMGKNCDIIPENPCFKNKCLNGICTPSGSNYTCNCHKNYEGEFCDEPKCDKDVYLNEVCNPEGTIDVISSDNKCLCICAKDFMGPKCETRLNLCELRSKNVEFENECLNGGTCIYNNKTNEAKCICQNGYFGDRCQITENHCKSSPCLYGNCRNERDTYKCSCSKGWEGRNCDKQINACNLEEDCVAMNTQQVLFSKNQCVCLCKLGFTGDKCQINVNNCESNTCQNDGKCLDLVSSFECKCQPGFTGPFCERKVENCELNPCKHGRCEMHGRLINCVCDKGYTGEFCENFINKCDPNPCKNNGKCHNLIDDYYCECPAEFGETKNCSTRLINPCDSSPCFHNGTCFPLASGSVKINGKSVNTFSGFKCHCLSNYKGEFCEQAADPCSSNPCNNKGQCVLSKDLQSYTCRCYPAFTGKYCETYFDPCERRDMCKNGGMCLATPEGHKCKCPPEFGGENCEKALNPCDMMKCLNGGECIVLNNVPHCKCPSTKFIGTRCEIDISLTTSAQKNSPFSSALSNSDLSCDLLGNDVGAIDYIFLALIIFGLIIFVIACVYVYVYIGIKRTKKYQSKVQYDNDVLGEINEIDRRFS
ncbi:unnamed protein product [Brachionus calyciflorus]|uniref:Uncharacterized protein n=1 Tax=Brachionus calyciflorus TaxID=104777 RepID=A0A813T4L2_9BILA|nr:unnamed protein product [Brachionus calyciflorus]